MWERWVLAYRLRCVRVEDAIGRGNVILDPKFCLASSGLCGKIFGTFPQRSSFLVPERSLDRSMVKQRLSFIPFAIQRVLMAVALSTESLDERDAWAAFPSWVTP